MKERKKRWGKKSDRDGGRHAISVRLSKVPGETESGGRRIQAPSHTVIKKAEGNSQELQGNSKGTDKKKSRQIVTKEKSS